MNKNVLEKSRIILEVKEHISFTFAGIQELKKLNVANKGSLILYNGYLIPAGVYDDYMVLNHCIAAIEGIDYNDINSIIKAQNIIIDSTASMSREDAKYALSFWTKFIIERKNRELIKQKKNKNRR